jgi:PadR family transcriptional regulator
MKRVRSLSAQSKQVLKTMVDAHTEWHYGYELSKETGLKSGTLYPILVRLCDQGLMKAAWRESESPNRPPRHVYRLTAHGVSVAREAAVRGATVRFVPKKATS